MPDRVSVVGFDDIPLVGDLSPALTTVRQDPLLAGELLVTSLLRLINGQAIKSRLIEPVLVPRESSASPLHLQSEHRVGRKTRHTRIHLRLSDTHLVHARYHLCWVPLIRYGRLHWMGAQVETQ